MSDTFSLSGKIIDVAGGRIFPGTVTVAEGKIVSVIHEENSSCKYILPGLIDAHVHIESSMLVPSEFARLAVVHGTVATVSDPHEIANVLGESGVVFMIENGERTPFMFNFGVPSCVPATGFESSGAIIDSASVGRLLQRPELAYLSEMMNFPGVIYGDREVHAKLKAAARYNKPVDGHAPGLSGDKLALYASSGISTDHECITREEAVEKINSGMKILIREGSAAKNFDELIPLMATHPDMLMFCSDDKHPDDLVKGHVNLLVARALREGFDPISVIRACTLNPVRHYGLEAGLLQPGDRADIVVVDNLVDFNILKTYIKGELVASEGISSLGSVACTEPNSFVAGKISAGELKVQAKEGLMKVIVATDGSLLTGTELISPLIKGDEVVADLNNDVLKLTVINRYEPSAPALAFIKGFGFKRGAMASTVAHDSHNIICVGTNDDDMVAAINAVINNRGGVAVTDGNAVSVLPLPVAGLMSAHDGYAVARKYEEINNKALTLGGKLTAPLMTLSFMALLVIPELKLSDKGLFDGLKFTFTSLFE